MKKSRKFDLVLFLIWPIIASLLSFLWHVNILGATILFFVLPGIYLSLRSRKCVARAALFSLTCLLFLLAAEYFAIKNSAWLFNPEALVLPRLLNTVALEAVLWEFAWVYLVTLFFEHFFDKDAHTNLAGPRLKFLFFAFMVVFISTLLLAVNEIPASVPYYYLILGIITSVIPISFVLFERPTLFTTLAKVTLYFTYLHFVMEITEMALGHWTFPGQFLYGLDLFAQKLPAEELLFWVILGGAAIVSLYQYFDEKR